MAVRARVLLAGATGLVGGFCLRQLLAREHVEVVALVRRADALAPAARLAVRVVDFERLDDATDAFHDCIAVVCALGTTLRAAGSRHAFTRVDHDYPVALARVARDAGAEHFGLVSAIGADPASRVFYNRVKGEVERDVRALAFPSLAIARPSLLLGPRAELRPAEWLGRYVGALAPPAWRPVHAAQVASALVACALRRTPGVAILENATLRRERAR